MFVLIHEMMLLLYAASPRQQLDAGFTFLLQRSPRTSCLHPALSPEYIERSSALEAYAPTLAEPSRLVQYLCCTRPERRLCTTGRR